MLSCCARIRIFLVVKCPITTSVRNKYARSFCGMSALQFAKNDAVRAVNANSCRFKTRRVLLGLSFTRNVNYLTSRLGSCINRRGRLLCHSRNSARHGAERFGKQYERAANHTLSLCCLALPLGPEMLKVITQSTPAMSSGLIARR
jgi:hypothetical protein